MFFPTKQRLCLSLLTISLAISPSLAHLCAREEVVTYKEVKNEYLKTFAQEKPEPELSGNLGEQKPKEFKLVIEELTDYDQHNLVATMLMHHGKLQKHEGIIDATFIRKMELICGGENTQQHLLGHLIPASMSVFGHIGFASLLINPTANIAELRKRQKIVQGFKELFETTYGQNLEKSFEIIKNAQVETLRYWQPEPEMNQDLFKRFYYGKYLQFLNKNSIVLECGTQLGNLLAALNILSPFIITTAINSSVLYQKQKRENDLRGRNNERITEISKVQIIWEAIKKIPGQIALLSPFKKAFKDKSLKEIDDAFAKLPYEQRDYDAHYDAKRPKSLGDVFYVLDEDAKVTGRIAEARAMKTVMLAYIGSITGLYAYGTKKTIESIRLNNTLTNHIQERLIAVATCIREAKNIYTVLQSHEATAQMPAVQQLANFFEKNGKRSAKLSDLLAKLETNTFKGKASFFSLTGRVLATHKLMQEVKDELIPLFEAVGNIEAYIAAAKLYSKHQDLPAKFCFAEFVDATQPLVALGNFWNPFISPEIVVANDAVFNSFEYLTSHAEIYHMNAQPTARNVILTGPNTAGKSTVIKATALNILLGQTFGICAADRALFTPFSIINCHLNITDDIATGSSLFQAEVTRAKELLTDIQSLPRNKFCFTLMDELFNGTNAEGGSKAAYKFADQLGNNYDNLILVIATHFPILTELEKTNNFRNLHVGAYLDDTGKLIRPFKLQEGVFQDPNNKILQAILEREGIFEQA